MMVLLGYMAAPPTILVISAEAMPEMPAAARKTQRLARKFHDVLLLGITGLIVRYADPYGSRGRKVSSALKCCKPVSRRRNRPDCQIRGRSRRQLG
jgi:hypothetical protein